MKIDMAASQSALSLDVKQSEAALRASQTANRVKAEAWQASAEVRFQYQTAVAYRIN